MVFLLLPILALRSCRYWYQLFRLCCLCLTETRPNLPPVRFRKSFSWSTESTCCGLTPCVANATNSIASCTTDETMGKYRRLRDQFDPGNVAGNRWELVDFFGRTDVFRKLIHACNTLPAVPSSSTSARSGPSSCSAVEDGYVTPSPCKYRKKPTLAAFLVSKFQRRMRNFVRRPIKTDCTFF